MRAGQLSRRGPGAHLSTRPQGGEPGCNFRLGWVGFFFDQTIAVVVLLAPGTVLPPSGVAPRGARGGDGGGAPVRATRHDRAARRPTGAAPSELMPLMPAGAWGSVATQNDGQIYRSKTGRFLNRSVGGFFLGVDVIETFRHRIRIATDLRPQITI